MRSEALLIRWWGKQGRAARYAVLTVAVPAALAVFVTAVSVFGARALVMLALRGAALMWRRLGTHGRLVAGMIMCWPAADALRAMGALPRWHVVSMLVGAAGTAVFGCALAAVRARGRRRWRAQGAVALAGGWQERADVNAAAIAADRARIETLEHEAAALRHEVTALCRGLSAACAAAGMNTQHPHRHLRAVGDGTGPLPRIS